MTIDPKVLARAQALKALAEGTDNPHEAELAAVRLAEYLDRHRIEAHALEDGPAAFGRVGYHLGQHRYVRASMALLGAVASHYGVVVVGPRTGNSKRPSLVGAETDIQMTVLMFESLIIQRDRACVVDPVPPGAGTTTHRNSFCYGYAIRIKYRLEELRERQRAAAVTDGDGKALELFDRTAAVTRFLEEDLGRPLGSVGHNKARLDSRGIIAGDTAARNADLGQTRVGNDGGPRAIGAGV